MIRLYKRRRLYTASPKSQIGSRSNILMACDLTQESVCRSCNSTRPCQPASQTVKSPQLDTYTPRHALKQLAPHPLIIGGARTDARHVRRRAPECRRQAGTDPHSPRKRQIKQSVVYPSISPSIWEEGRALHF